MSHGAERESHGVVILFAWIAGVDLDLYQASQYRRESGIMAGLAAGINRQAPGLTRNQRQAAT